MTQSQVLRRLKRSHWRSLERIVKRSYQAGLEAGLARAHGAGRRGRTIRADATIEGLVRRIERHFGLERYAFEVRVVHPRSARRLPSRDLLLKHLTAE
jgi:ribosome modulation factor